MLLRLTAVNKQYRGTNRPVTALDNVSLEIAAGQFVAVRGPSGCGKSTLLMTAGTLLRPDSGVVTLADHDPYAMTPDERARFRARSIGFVFQQFHLIPYLTVRANVLAPSIAADLADADARADELIERFGLAGRADHVPADLSTGERQRAALARALLARPKLLLADEPTGNLDSGNARTVMQALADFTSGGGAVLLVTHDDRAAGFATRNLRMDLGKIAEPS